MNNSPDQLRLKPLSFLNRRRKEIDYTDSLLTFSENLDDVGQFISAIVKKLPNLFEVPVLLELGSTGDFQLHVEIFQNTVKLLLQFGTEATHPPVMYTFQEEGTWVDVNTQVPLQQSLQQLPKTHGLPHKNLFVIDTIKLTDRTFLGTLIGAGISEKALIKAGIQAEKFSPEGDNLIIDELGMLASPRTIEMAIKVLEKRLLKNK